MEKDELPNKNNPFFIQKDELSIIIILSYIVNATLPLNNSTI